MSRIFKYIILLIIFIFNVGFVNALDNEIEDFAIISSDVVNLKQLYITFNSKLYDGEDAIRDFRIVNKNDIFDELYVSKVELNEKNNRVLLLTFDNEATLNAEYELLVIDLLDEYGRNIKMGINSILTFKMTEDNINKEVIIEVDEMTSTGQIEEIEEVVNTEIEKDNNSGENLSGLELDAAKNLELNSAKNLVKISNKLPDTGPTNYLIIVLLSILSSMILLLKFKKS